MVDPEKGLDIRIHGLDWTEFQEAALPKTDLVVGSDLVYAPAIIPGNLKKALDDFI